MKLKGIDELNHPLISTGAKSGEYKKDNYVWYWKRNEGQYKAEFNDGSKEFKLLEIDGDVYSNKKYKLPTINIKEGYQVVSSTVVRVNSRSVWPSFDEKLGTVEVFDDKGNLLFVEVLRAD